MSREKIGVGIITCDRPDFLSKCLKSIDRSIIDELVIVDDGNTEIDINVGDSSYISTTGRAGVAVAKNTALKHLYEYGCDYLFIIEDDTIVTNNDVFQKYIEACKKTGIQHFNYGPGTPFNRKQSTQFDIHNRHNLDQLSDPNPRKIIEYSDDIKIALYTHVAGMFSFFTKRLIDDVGYMDERYYNAWEHVDHTYNIIKAGYHPPFWYFADISDSHDYITEMPDAIEKSSISKDNSEWMEAVNKGRELYLSKHGHYPNNPPMATDQSVITFLKKLKPHTKKK